MSERRKVIKRKKEAEASEQSIKSGQDEKPSPIEYEVAKYLRNKLPEKKTTLLGVWVDYFIASKAIDCLLDSKWATRPAGSAEDALFTTRESVVDFLDSMLHHKFFHRAKKIIVKEKKKKAIKDSEETTESKETKELKETKEIKEGETKELEGKEGKEKKKKEGKEKRKVKLDMHMEQTVIDANEPYVWIYEPLSIKSCVFGFLLVFGVVAVCLFPLWPSSIRNWVYYLSVAVASFLVFIISLALLKLIIFVIIWGITFGNHHFWILPNLTEDVGFFESFWPLYSYEYKGGQSSSSSSSSSSEGNKVECADLSKEKKKKKKQQKSAGEEGGGEEEEDQSAETDPLLPANENARDEEEVEEYREEDALQSGEQGPEEEEGEENESSSSENDSIKNNGFEIVDNKDVPEILNLKL